MGKAECTSKGRGVCLPSEVHLCCYSGSQECDRAETDLDCLHRSSVAASSVVFPILRQDHLKTSASLYSLFIKHRDGAHPLGKCTASVLSKHAVRQNVVGRHFKIFLKQFQRCEQLCRSRNA